jgi:ADP-ribose pyrophosphatase
MRILNIEKLTDENWLNLFAAHFEHNGHEGRWLFASRHDQPTHGPGRGDAVAIVPLLRAEGEPPRLVLVREYRVPLGDYLIGIPAGLLEEGESVEECARRELLEETGLELVRVTHVTPPLYSSAGLTDEAVIVAFVEARQLPGQGLQLDPSEDLEVLLLDYEAVCRLCDDSRVRFDMKTWMALYHYRQLGKLA